MRLLTLAVFSSIAALAQAEPSLAPLDLDRPGAMQSVARDNPQLYRKITRIRDLASRMPCPSDEFRTTLAARFDARDAACGVFLMTSFPSKRQLQFTLGERRYITVVEMDESANKLIAAK